MVAGVFCPMKLAPELMIRCMAATTPRYCVVALQQADIIRSATRKAAGGIQPDSHTTMVSWHGTGTAPVLCVQLISVRKTNAPKV